MELFTLNFQRFTPAMGIPVRISNGSPRWNLKYDLDYAVRELFPAWSLVQDSKKGRLNHEDFTRLFQEQLSATGVPVIRQRFEDIIRANGGEEQRLVLMCFEDLATGKTCHRRSFARWWEAQTGERVRELGPTGPTGRGPATGRSMSQGLLF